ncbi:MAG: alpha/beta fold hydrolase [Dongiaceae bacterium]
MDSVFDREGIVRRPPSARLVSELGRLLFHHPPPPDPATLPSGRNHVVLVLPAVLTGDGATRPLRSFLQRCGYRVFGWELGVNWGPTPRLLDGSRQRLEALAAIEAGPISLIGVSLGGLMARDLAHRFPHRVRQVATLGSPFRLPTATPLEPLFRLLARYYSADIDPRRLAAPLPMRSIELYSREDGLVAPETCFTEEPGQTARETARDVGGAHMTICRNPAALAALARALAEPL